MRTKHKALILCIISITLIPSLMVFALNEGDAAEENRAAYGISCVLCRIANLIFLIIASLAAVVIILAGLKWLTSGDDPGARNAAKTTIVSAFVGIIIVFIAVFVVAGVMQGLGGSFDMVRVEDWINSNECDNQCTLARGYSEDPATEESSPGSEEPMLSALSVDEECGVKDCGGGFLGIGSENCDPHEICNDDGDCEFSPKCCSGECGETECSTVSGIVSCGSAEKCVPNNGNPSTATACTCRITYDKNYYAECCHGRCPGLSDGQLTGECSDESKPACGTGSASECECLTTAYYAICTDYYDPPLPGIDVSEGCFDDLCGTYCGPDATEPCEDYERCIYMEDKYQCVEDSTC